MDCEFGEKRCKLLHLEWIGVPIIAQWKAIQLETIRFQVQFLASLSGFRIQCCCELRCCRCGLDMALLWLLNRPVATAPIRPPCLGMSICCRYSCKKLKNKIKGKPRRGEAANTEMGEVLLVTGVACSPDPGWVALLPCPA